MKNFLLLFASAFVLTLSAKPLKVGLYVDEGSRGGYVAWWAEMLGASKDVDLSFLTGEALRGGALTNGYEMLVVPGGSGFAQYESMREKGARAIRDFVRGGGKYFGTCAGIALLLNETNRVALLPYRRIDHHYLRGSGSLRVAFTDEAVKTYGLAKKEWTLSFSNGPVLVPAARVEGTVAKTIGTCLNGIDDKKRFPKWINDMVGTPAFVSADCGKGKIFACNCHPEAFEDTRELIRRGFAALVGRPVDFPELKPPHCIPCGKVRNLRDLGGMKGLDGRTIRMRQLYRSGALAVDDTTRNFLLKCLKLKTEIDLRNGPECRGRTGSPLGPGVKWEHLTVKSYTLQKGTNGTHRLIFNVLCDEKRYPVDFHCMLGQDRTGTIAMLALGTLGVSEEDVMTDYLRTNKRLQPTKLAAVIKQLKDEYPAPTFAESCEKYLLSIGVTADQIAAFRRFLLDAK